MKTVWFAIAFGAAPLLSASTVAVNAMGAGAAAICQRHARSISILLCRGVTVGGGRLPARPESAHGQSFGNLLG